MKRIHKVAALVVMLVLVMASFRLTHSLPTEQDPPPSTSTATITLNHQSEAYQKVLELNGKAADTVSERVRRKMAELDKRGITGDERRRQLTEEIKAAGQDMRHTFQENNKLLPSRQPHAPDAR